MQELRKVGPDEFEFAGNQRILGLQNFLLATPDAGDVIAGGFGLRKLRWMVRGRGKRVARG